MYVFFNLGWVGSGTGWVGAVFDARNAPTGSSNKKQCKRMSVTYSFNLSDCERGERGKGAGDVKAVVR